MPGAEFKVCCRSDSVREIVKHNTNCACKDCCLCCLERRKPRKPRRKIKCGRYDKACPQRIEQIALPTLRHTEHTLQRYGSIMYPERVVNLCKLVQELRYPQPQAPNFWSSAAKKQQRRKSRRKRCKTRKSCDEWLERQTCASANTFKTFIKSMRDYIPGYKQLRISTMLYSALEFRKVRSNNQYVTPELKLICDKLAILIDNKLQPYKQSMRIEKMSVSTLEDKHVVFKMFDLEYESATEIEEEEEETLYPISVYDMPTSLQYEESDEYAEAEALSRRTTYVEEQAYFAEGQEEDEETDKSITDEHISKESLAIIEVAESVRSETIGSTLYEMEMEEEAAVVVVVEEKSLHSEEVVEAVVDLYPISEEESIMEAPKEEEEEEEEEEVDYHLDGTSSFVDWCLYVSWLKEFGSNIEMYAMCLQQFRCVLAKDDAGKHKDMLQFLLSNWSKYLADSRRVDNEMTQYFKNKPMTWCSKCRDCTIDDYPRDHFIPPELEGAIRITKEWRRLLSEAEEYCRKLCVEGEEEGEEAEGVEELYEICDVSGSSTSSYDIQIISTVRPSTSHHT